MEVYLDNCATTKILPDSFESLMYILNENYGNPSSLHKKGLMAEEIIDDSKKIIAKHLSCKKDEIIFTYGATESNNMAILGTAKHTRKKTIITSAIEHSSVLGPLKMLENEGYNVIKVYPNEEGVFYVEDFTDKITDDTFLISVMHINNETGTIMPIEEISKKAKQIDKTIIVHCDAVQSFCKFPDFCKENIDMVSLSGHKIHSPKGIGILYVKKHTKIKPIIYGGGQQNSLRPGTENVAYIKLLSDTIDYLHSNVNVNYEKFKHLNEYALDKLSTIKNIKVNTYGNMAPHILNICVLNIKSEVLIHFLAVHNIFVSSGSSCSKGKESHVLKAFNICKSEIESSIRISFSIYTTFKDIDHLIEGIKLANKNLIKS